MFTSLYITVLHTSHIIVNYKYISFVAQLYIVRLDFVAVGNMCVTNSQTIAPVHLYFHPEVRTHAPYIYASFAHERRVTLRMRPMQYFATCT